MKLFSTLLGAILMLNISYAQKSDLYKSLEIKQAYEKGTRSIDGKPGVNYWQNTVDYKIQVAVNPGNREITGSENIVYYNNSPDLLNKLVIRIYYDVYKKNNFRKDWIKEEDFCDGIILENLVMNGDSINLDDKKTVRRKGTNLFVAIEKGLPPHAKLELSLDWKQKVPFSNIRSGVLDSTSFFVGQWYPQVAVYDDVFGWDLLNYDLRTEFYNNLANFDVLIDVPDNYLVWATGTFENSKEVLPKKIYKRYKKAHKSEEVINVVDSVDLESFKSRYSKWHFKADEVSDFAFAMSNHYLWDATSLKVADKRVFISTVYPISQKDNSKYIETTNTQVKSMKYMSENIPGIPYPYEAFTTVLSASKVRGGMEYPMMANNNYAGEEVVIHEMFHTYFPMYVRTNEKRFAWMDEGWAEFNTDIIEKKLFQEDKYSIYNFKSTSIGTSKDLPIMITSKYLDTEDIYYMWYLLPSFTYSILYDYLGEDKFLLCYREYINRWAKKSPVPYDFFNTFEDVSGEDLDWLWRPWYFDYGYFDVSIKSFDGGVLTIEKLGNKPVPIEVEVEYADNTISYVRKNAGIWKGGIHSTSINIENAENVKAITVNNNIDDVDVLNNYYPSIYEMYDVKLYDDILGTYSVNEYSFLIKVYIDRGILKLNLVGTPFDMYIKPTSKNEFQSLDEQFLLKLEKNDEGRYSYNLKYKKYKTVLTGEKQ